MIKPVELPQVFYERLLERDWEDDVVNGCRILTKTDPDGCIRFEIWPVKKESGVLKIVSGARREHGELTFRIEHRDQNNWIVDCLEPLEDDTPPAVFIEALLRNADLTVYEVKFYQKQRGQKAEEYRKPVTLDTLANLDDIRFEPIEWIDFYLAGQLASELTLPKKNFEAACRLLSEAFKAKGKTLDADNLLDAIENLFYTKPLLDADGNITHIPFGGDVWDFEFLDLLKDFFVPGSSLILQDDGGIYWKVVIDPDRLRYFREEVF